jgi:hypothetical protein
MTPEAALAHALQLIAGARITQFRVHTELPALRHRGLRQHRSDCEGGDVVRGGAADGSST